MTLREAQVLTLSVLKQVMEEKLDQHNVQLAQVRLILLGQLCHNFCILGDSIQGIRDLGRSEVERSNRSHVI
jgi:hypothetical protein